MELIHLKSKKSVTGVLLGKGLEFLETFQYVVFASDGVYRVPFGEVINKGDVIPRATERRNLNGS